MSLTAYLVNPVVIDGGRTHVRVRGRGFGRVRVGDVRFWVFGEFDRTLSVKVAPRIEAKLDSSRVMLTPAIAPPMTIPATPNIEVPVPDVDVVVPHAKFDIAVRLYEYVPPVAVKRDRGEM